MSTVIAANGNFSTTVFVGNSTVNATTNSTSLIIGSSTVNSTVVSVGTSTINSTVVSVGSNVVLSTSSILIGNSTVNVAANSTALAINGLPATVPVGTTIYFNTSTPPTGFLAEDGSAVSRTTYASLFAVLVRTATVTITIASPGVISWTAHGLSAGDPIKFTTTGALPTGITASTTYYVISAGLTTDSFRISATAGGAAVNTSGSQSGTHTGIYAPHGDGDGSTTFNLPDSRGYFIRGWDKGAGVDTNRAFGSSQTDRIASHAVALRWMNAPADTYGNYLATAIHPFAGSYGYGGTYYNYESYAGYYYGSTETAPKNKAKLACIKY